MPVSTFDIFKLGVGPSSSHTMGPMEAARRFVERLAGRDEPVERIETKLYSSLALTGKGHATDRAVILGLAGFSPASFDPNAAEAALSAMRASGRLTLATGKTVAFDEGRDLVWAGRERLPHHPNALTFAAFDPAGALVEERTWYSIGGGFIRDQEEIGRNAADEPGPDKPYPFASGAELVDAADKAGLTIAQLMAANEAAVIGAEETERRLDGIIDAMGACIDRGMAQSGELPGGLRVKRRAAEVYRAIVGRIEQQMGDPLAPMDFVNLWALAVNEENAAGGRVVTAPTNGAAGVIPAVLRFYDRFYRGTPEGRRAFLLTAAAIGALYKKNASISGAEVGCQGEVGVACSMAAAGLAAVLGGTNAQIENAAEIGMEHNLGLTCDPIGGLVQIPCIERNAMGAVKAIDAARLALLGDGQHSVSLDKVIATMKRTGADMNAIYKETSLGGLAVNVVEC
jgi:L-serine dehydratase